MKAETESPRGARFLFRALLVATVALAGCGGGGDDGGSSAPDARIYTESRPTVPLGTLIKVFAEGVTDVGEDRLACSWSLVSVPTGSAAVVSDPDGISTSFVVDLPGDYIIRLTVSDGKAHGTDEATFHANDTNAVAMYSFEEQGGAEATDSSGNGLHGTIVGASRVVGKVGNGLLFTEEGSRVELPSQGSVFARGEISIEAWIQLTQLDPIKTYQIIGDQDYGAKSYRLQMNGGRLELLLYQNPWLVAISSEAEFSIGQWHHVAVTFDGDEARAYVDGSQIGRTPFSSLIEPSVNVLYVGALDESGANGFPGYIDELRIYNHVRSGEDISSYYESTR